MAKELPYFRFTVSEWLNDNISLESYKTKGVFSDVCAWYWFKDCSVDLTMLNKRFSDASGVIKELIDLEIIKLNGNNSIKINFLDVQYDLLSEKRQKFVDAGRIGGLKRSSNAKATLKQRSSYKDKDNNKEKDNDKREKNFYTQILEFSKDYSKEMLREFYDYWIEPNKNNTKMRFELERTWLLSARLKRWSKNNFGKKDFKQEIITDSSTIYPEIK